MYGQDILSPLNNEHILYLIPRIDKNRRKQCFIYTIYTKECKNNIFLNVNIFDILNSMNFN